MRTTIDIDGPILAELKQRQKKEKKSLGRLVSDLLAMALHDSREAGDKRMAFRWIAKPMGARIDLSDREAVYDALDGRSNSRDDSE
jgi:hypothetical protein